MELPSNRQLYLPILESLLDGGGTPQELYGKIANRAGVSPEVAAQVALLDGGKPVNLFNRRVRWARQDLVGMGLLRDGLRGWWEMAESGRKHLAMARPGVVLNLFSTRHGSAWWASVESMSAVVADQSIQAIITSPPYPINCGRSYGRFDAASWVPWMVDVIAELKRTLTPDGSLLLNLKDCWEPGRPVVSDYQMRLMLRLRDELGLFHCQNIFWNNPCAIPASSYVTVDKHRLVDRMESIYWLSPSERPKARAGCSALRRPYSARHRRDLDRGIIRSKTRPSGHGTSRNGFSRDAGGSLPDNLIRAGNGASGDHYCRAVRRAGLPLHPARFPAALAEFAVNLTTDPGDPVWDPFCGSGTVAEACEALGREWIASDRCMDYLCGASLRPRIRAGLGSETFACA